MKKRKKAAVAAAAATAAADTAINKFKQNRLMGSFKITHGLTFCLFSLVNYVYTVYVLIYLKTVYNKEEIHLKNPFVHKNKGIFIVMY